MPAPLPSPPPLHAPHPDRATVTDPTCTNLSQQWLLHSIQTIGKELKIQTDIPPSLPSSAYHNLDPEARYPPFLMTTSTRDDRVHPYHARCFVKRLSETGNAKRLHYYENIEGQRQKCARQTLSCVWESCPAAACPTNTTRAFQGISNTWGISVSV